MKSRFCGRNPTFRPCHRPVTPMDVLDSDGGIGHDLHVTSIDRKGRTCLFRPLLIFCHIVFNLSVNKNHPSQGDIYLFPSSFHPPYVRFRTRSVHRYSGNGQESVPLPAVTE